MSTQYTITQNNSSLSIDLNGGYVTRWQIGENDILYQGSELKRTGIPILFPNFGKSHTLPQHGFGRNVLWHLKEQKEDSLSMEITHEDFTEEMKKLYPYQFNAVITTSLRGATSDAAIPVSSDTTFIYKLIVTNPGPKPMHISPGIHPYWAIDHTLKSQVTIPSIPQFKSNEIDWDNNPPDINYPMPPKTEINFPDKTLTIEDITEGGQQNTLLQIWSQPIEKPDHNFICFEPITRDNYDLEKNPIIIPSHGEWRMNLLFTIHLQP